MFVSRMISVGGLTYGKWSSFRRTLAAERRDQFIDAQGLIKSALIRYLVDALRGGLARHAGHSRRLPPTAVFMPRPMPLVQASTQAPRLSVELSAVLSVREGEQAVAPTTRLHSSAHAKQKVQNGGHGQGNQPLH